MPNCATLCYCCYYFQDHVVFQRALISSKFLSEICGRVWGVVFLPSGLSSNFDVLGLHNQFALNKMCFEKYNDKEYLISCKYSLGRDVNKRISMQFENNDNGHNKILS